MEYKKERNFIVAYEDGVVQGKWDIITGNFYGKKDKPISSVPHAFTFDQLSQWGMSGDSGYYAGCVRTYRNDHQNVHHYNSALYEQVISLKLKFESLYVFGGDTSNISLTKDVVEFLNQEYRGFFKVSYVREYLINKQYKDFINTLSDQSKAVFVHLVNDLPFEYLKSMLNRMEKEHVIEYNFSYGSFSLEGVIRRYYNMCMEMYGTVKVEPNIISNYIQICHLYKCYKEANYDTILEKNNNKKFLYFENDEIIAFPLLSKEAFHKEAEAQHNCVERMYMEKVINNETYIVSVRKKNSPDTSYITCEVTHDGMIRQYLLACNNPVRDSSAIHFRFHYQNYIYQHLKEA